MGIKTSKIGNLIRTLLEWIGTINIQHTSLLELDTVKLYVGEETIWVI